LRDGDQHGEARHVESGDGAARGEARDDREHRQDDGAECGRRAIGALLHHLHQLLHTADLRAEGEDVADCNHEEEFRTNRDCHRSACDSRCTALCGSLAVGQPAIEMRERPQEQNRHRHDADEPDCGEPRRAAIDALRVENPLDERRHDDAAHREPGRRDGECAGALHGEPARDHRGHRPHTRRRPAEGVHAVHDEEMPALSDELHAQERARAEHRADEHDDSHVVFGDELGDGDRRQSADEEEERGRRRDRRDRPPEFAAERLQIHRESVEADARGEREQHERRRQHEAPGKTLARHRHRVTTRRSR